MNRLIFDKGTLLLEGVEKSKIQENIASFFLWDSRVASYRAPAYQYPAIIKTLPSYIAEQNTPTKFKLKEPIQLRPYQQAALSTWDQTNRRGVIVLPTGSGKTLVAVAAIALLSMSTLILVPTRVLLEQWENLLILFFGKPIGVLGDKKKFLFSITVATFESAYRYMSQIGNQFQFLVVDEVHHFGNGIRDEALEMAICPYRLGLTATYVTKDSTQKKLNDLIGPLVYQSTIQELKDDFLSPFTLFTLQVNLTPQERRQYDLLMQEFRKEYLPFIQLYPDSDWIHFLSFTKKNKNAQHAYWSWKKAKKIILFPTAKEVVLSSLLTRHIQNKTLVFTPDTNTAYQIAKKHLVMPITSEIQRKERENALIRFREGKLKTLVSCRVLNEGVDVPDAEVAIVVGGTYGEREHIQRIGRCLRPKEGKKATIYELVVRNSIEVKHWQKRTQSLEPRIITFP